MTTNIYTPSMASESIRPRRRDGQRGRTLPDIIKNLPCNCPKDRHFRQLYGGSLSYRRHLRGCNQHAAESYMAALEVIPTSDRLAVLRNLSFIPALINAIENRDRAKDRFRQQFHDLKERITQTTYQPPGPLSPGWISIPIPIR